MSQASDSELYERNSQSQFVSQEGDEDILWEVIEITAEKSKYYKVRWVGFNPETNKPWSQSWVPKSDCTDDLVQEWKRRKVMKRKKGSRGSRLSRASRLSDISHVSMNSLSTVTKHSAQKQNLITSINHARNNGKRARSAALSDEEYHENELNPDLPHIKKRRKVIADDSKVAEPHSNTRRKKGQMLESTSESGNENEVLTNPQRDRAKRNTRRKKEPILESFSESGNENEVLTNPQRDRAKSKVLPVKLEEEENTSDEEATAPIQPASSPSCSPTTDIRNVKPRPSSNTRPSTVTSDSDTAYVKLKSGKLSTRKKRRQRLEKSALISSDEADLLISSDKVEEVAQVQKSPSPLPTKHNNSLPTLSSTTLRQLQACHSPSLSDPHADEDHMVQEMYDEYVDFDAAHQQPSNSVCVSKADNGAKDESYRQGEVPETETESSRDIQSQSQSQSVVPLPKQQQPNDHQSQPASSPENDHPKSLKAVKEREALRPSRAPTLILPPHTPSRSSIISRMRPRTPGSSLSFDNRLAFHQPELEMHVEVEVEKEKSEAETTPEHQKPASTTSRTSKAESGPLRPIPRLSPSVFKPHLPSESSASIHHSGTDIAPAEESDEAEVAELVSSIEQFTSPEKSERKRKVIQDKADRKGKGKQPAHRHADAEGSVMDDDDSAEEELENVVRLRGEQLAARAQAKRQSELAWAAVNRRRKVLYKALERKKKQGVKEHDGEYDEHNGEYEGRKRRHEPEQRLERKKSRSSGTSSQDAEHESVKEDNDILRFRQEEEESTQDLIMNILDVPMEDVEQSQGWDVETSRQVTKEIEPPEPPPKDDTRASSKSKSSLHSVRPGHRNPSQDELVLPPTASVPTSTPIEVNLPRSIKSHEYHVDHQSQEQDTRPDLVATLALLNEKSQENAQLMKEIDALRAAASVPRPRELELEQELEVVRASLEAIQVSLAASEKRAADLARGKESAEKDREFFREYYAKASGFVTSVQDENAELLKEAQIAKEQASTGVEVVKATYMARVHALEDDARTYKRLAMFIVEKDTRTNDDIRRRAAEEPELRARCDELGKELREVRNEMMDLQEEVDDKEMKIEELEQQLDSWKRQTTVLNADLSQVKSLQEGVDKVYQCGWRIDDDVNVPCDQVFTTYEEFERHMFTERHLNAKHMRL